MVVDHRQTRLIEGYAKRHLKRLTCTGTLRQVFLCFLSQAPAPPRFLFWGVLIILYRRFWIWSDTECKTPAECREIFFLCSKIFSVADPWHFGVDPDPEIHASRLMDPDLDADPAFFIIHLQDANKVFLQITFFKVHFSKIKSKKKSQHSRNQGFSYYFCLMIEGYGAGSIPLTNGSGSGSRRPKNMWIRTRIRIRKLIILQ